MDDSLLAALVQWWRRAVKAAPGSDAVAVDIWIAQVRSLLLTSVALRWCEVRGLIVSTEDGLGRIGRSDWSEAFDEAGWRAWTDTACHNVRHGWNVCLPIGTLPPPAHISPNLVKDLWTLLMAQSAIAIELLGQVYEATLSATRRKGQGSFYTPEPLVQYMVSTLLYHWFQRHDALPKVLDPACGGGAFLVAVFRVGLQRGQSVGLTDWLHCLYGVDVDAQAVAITRLSLQMAYHEAHGCDQVPTPLPDCDTTIRWANTLTDSLPATVPARYDVVLGNPPYMDSQWMSVHQPDLRAFCNQRYQVAQGNWDLFCVFIERSLELCNPGGFHSFVVPNKLLCVPYAAAARSLLASHRLLQLRDYARVPAFAAAVYPLVYAVQVNSTEGSVDRVVCDRMLDLHRIEQSGWLTRDRFERSPWRLFPVSAKGGGWDSLPTLGHLATVHGAASVSDAYVIHPLIQEGSPTTPGLRVVNSGTLDCYQLLWGIKPMRYLGDRFHYPVIPPELESCLPKRRSHQARQPKLIVASMTKTLECAIDATGAILAGKSTSIIQPTHAAVDIYYLLGLLNSTVVQRWFCNMFGGNALQGGYLRIGPAQLRAIPIPLVEPAGRDRLIGLVRDRLRLMCPKAQADCDRQIDQQVAMLYGDRSLD
ncbi:Eco57I restriction-modification methylase domain-containing protein [Leptolyngbya sp. AN02str]|uniref:Eco57I restriction-modification methylase domain-containing protein n=1 Tax=Leptolyngbya sp. AN02str TaxID=3423363 RepID=UPI003D320C2B